MRAATYIPEDHIDRDPVLRAERDSGILVLWRTGEGGRQWYKRVSPIRAVPVETDDIEVAEDNEPRVIHGIG